jgi:hypothetical protein
MWAFVTCDVDSILNAQEFLPSCGVHFHHLGTHKTAVSSSAEVFKHVMWTEINNLPYRRSRFIYTCFRHSVDMKEALC